MDVLLAADAHEAARDADEVVLVTEWPQYLDLDWESLASVMRTPVLLETHGTRWTARASRGPDSAI